MFRVIFFVGFCSVCSVESVETWSQERSLRDLGLLALTRA